MSELQVPDNDDTVFTEDEYEEEEDDDRVQHGEIIFLNLTSTINLTLKISANRTVNFMTILGKLDHFFEINCLF